MGDVNLSLIRAIFRLPGAHTHLCSHTHTLSFLGCNINAQNILHVLGQKMEYVSSNEIMPSEIKREFWNGAYM
jgi:hypothetical protein